MVDGLGIISMTRVFESYGIEPYDYFVQENLQVNFTNDFEQLAEICAIIDRQWNGEAVANLSFKNKYGSDTCSMKVFVIEIIQSPVGQMNLLLIFFLTYYSVSVYWINLNLIRVKNLRSSRGGNPQLYRVKLLILIPLKI